MISSIKNADYTEPSNSGITPPKYVILDTKRLSVGAADHHSDDHSEHRSLSLVLRSYLHCTFTIRLTTSLLTFPSAPLTITFCRYTTHTTRVSSCKLTHLLLKCRESNMFYFSACAGLVFKQTGKMEKRGKVEKSTSSGVQFLQPYSNQQQLQCQCLPASTTTDYTRY